MILRQSFLETLKTFLNLSWIHFTDISIFYKALDLCDLLIAFQMNFTSCVYH